MSTKSGKEQYLPSEDRGKIKCYRQYTHHLGGYNWGGFFATPNSGDKHGISDNDYLLYPIDGKLLPPPYSNQYSQHVNPGLLMSPLKIQYNHQPKIKCGGNSLLIENLATLII